jgi:hypothetical protein
MGVGARRRSCHFGLSTRENGVNFGGVDVKRDGFPKRNETGENKNFDKK